MATDISGQISPCFSSIICIILKIKFEGTHEDDFSKVYYFSNLSMAFLKKKEGFINCFGTEVVTVE